MLFKIIVLVLIFLIPLIPTFWAILDIPRRRFPSTKSKMIWFAVVSTLPCVGGIFYFLLGRRQTQPIGSDPDSKFCEPAPDSRQP
ncbi:MAG: PLD nuclease N-terminal domain-containing protein [Syntrophobacteraceae bacterium]